jgi:hypothetical protein
MTLDPILLNSFYPIKKYFSLYTFFFGLLHLIILALETKLLCEVGIDEASNTVAWGATTALLVVIHCMLSKNEKAQMIHCDAEEYFFEKIIAIERGLRTTVRKPTMPMPNHARATNILQRHEGSRSKAQTQKEDKIFTIASEECGESNPHASQVMYLNPPLSNRKFTRYCGHGHLLSP